ncbi:MAG: formate/nitrite transporter family protein [Anaerolineaceae bacterium]|nr:formate/nitrite transporter family protein [Anaerolineaceae bacterium]
MSTPFSMPTPALMLEKASTAGTNKAKLRFGPMFILAILAGIYIGFGGVFSTLVATQTNSVWPYGFVKMLQGLVFSLGLILVIIGGAELFTGNMLMIIPFLQRKISIGELLRNWGSVYLGNFIGSLILAMMIVLSGFPNFSNGLVGETMVKIADAKLHYSFLQAFMLGTLCNILVCLAVWLCYAANSLVDKAVAIIFPVSAFIAAGFEHSIANMYLIPAGLLIKSLNPTLFSQVAVDPSAFSLVNFLTQNLIPVTLGNMIGGSLFVGIAYFLIFSSSSSNMTQNDHH